MRETVDNCVINTTEFIDKIDEMQLEDNEYLASLDVIELFPNVSVNKATSTIIKRNGQSEAFCNSSLTKIDLHDLLNLCLQNNYSTFNNKFYRQTCGLSMGNILSPLLADLVMDEFMKTKLKKISKKLIRYVDDIFILTEMTEIELKLFVDKLNLLKDTIKFTYEFEKDKKLNYLDTTLTRNIVDKRIDIKWFRKDTASDRLLHFESDHHKSIKLNIITNMATRIINTTRNNNQQLEDLNKLKEMLIKSKYPMNLIEKSIQNCLHKIILTTTTEQLS